MNLKNGLISMNKRKEWSFRQYYNEIKRIEYILSKTKETRCYKDHKKYLIKLKEELQLKERGY